MRVGGSYWTWIAIPLSFRSAIGAALPTVLALLLTAIGMVRAAAFQPELPEALVFERQALAAAYMAGSEESDGSFVYEFDLIAGSPVENDNIVRQAGAGFGLAMYLAHADRLDLAPRVGRALQYYRGQSRPFGNGRLVSADSDVTHAQTGATALALLAELFYWEATGSAADEDLRRDWLEGIAALWRPEGGFASGPGAADRSSYYDGEAWLALAHYERLFPGDPTTAALLQKVDQDFLTHYREHPDIGFMHWGLLATAERYRSTGNTAFMQYASQLAELLLTELQPHFSPYTNACYLVEGLAAAAELLEHQADYLSLVTRLSSRIGAEMANALELQLLQEQTQVDFDTGRFLYDETLPALAGAFLNGRFVLRTRIDFTQHCLAALIGYERWQKRRGAVPAGADQVN